MLMAPAANAAGTDGRKGQPVRMRHLRTAVQTPAKSLSAASLAPEAGADIKKAPARALAGNVKLYGWLGYSDDEEATEGFYEFKGNSYTLRWDDPENEFMSYGWVVQTAWLSDDGSSICGYAVDTDGFNIFDAAYVEYDFTTGNLLRKDKYPIDTFPQIQVSVYNTSDGYIYSFAFDVDGNPVWIKASAATPTTFETVRGYKSGDPLPSSMTYCEADGLIYAIASGKLYSLDKDINVTEIISDLGVRNLKPYMTGLAYSGTDNLLYWNTNAINSEITDYEAIISSLYTINLLDKKVEKVMDFPFAEEFMALFAPSSKVADDTPMSAQLVGHTLTEGALSGEMTFRTPATLGDGSAITSEMNWTFLVDGQSYSTGKAAADSEVKIPLSDLPEGLHQFSFVVELNGKTSRPAGQRLYVGNDTPAAPENVNVTPSAVTWDAVPASGVSGGYVNPAEVTYELFVNNQSRGTYNTCSAPVAVVDANAPYNAYFVKVVARFADKASAPSANVKTLGGQPLKMPYTCLPTSAQFDLYTVINGNNDSMSWVVRDEQNEHFFNSQYSENGEADDYLILPPLDFDDADAYYEFSIEARSRRCEMYPEEYVEILIGDKPEIASMTRVLVEKTQLVDDYKEIFSLFKVPAAGAWYIAVRNCSALDQYGVFARNVSVKKSVVNDLSPVAVTDLTCTPGSNGELKSSVTFTMPSKRMNGADIPAGTTLQATVLCSDRVTVSGNPGEKVSADVITAQGNNPVIVRVSDGANMGPDARSSVYTGVTVPGLARNVKALCDESNRVVRLTWDAPEAGVDGGFIRPAEVGYEIFRYSPAGWEKLATLDRDVRMYIYDASDIDGEGMAFVQLGVRCFNEAGGNSMVGIGTAMIGTPYDMPFEDGFDTLNGDGMCVPQIGPWMMMAPDNTYTAEWGYSRLSQMLDDWKNLEGGAMVCDPKGQACKGRIALPKVSTFVDDNEEAVLSIRPYTGSGCPSLVTVLAETYDSDEPVEIGTVKRSGNGFRDIDFILPASLINRNWIQLIFDVKFASANELFVLDKLSLTAREKSGVDAVEGALRVYGTRGAVVVKGAEGGMARVYSVDGKLMAASTESTIVLPAGIYVVKVSGKTFKVNVK